MSIARAGLLRVIAAAVVPLSRSRPSTTGAAVWPAVAGGALHPCSGRRLGRAHALSLGDRSRGQPRETMVCVFITAGPIIKLWLANNSRAISEDPQVPAQFWPDYLAPPSPPADDALCCVFLGTYPATPTELDITGRRMHRALGYDDEQRVGIIDLVEWYHPSSSTFKFARTLPSSR